jgi:hypothetical protein
MKRLLILILVIIVLFTINNIENFSYFNPYQFNDSPLSLNKNKNELYKINYPINNNNNKTPSIFDNRFNLMPITSNLKQHINDDKCCLIKKVLKNNNIYEYTYKTYYQEDCNIDNFELDQNNQLFIDGKNNWSNNLCSNDKSKLGSCKHYDFECVDFIPEDLCNKYNDKMPPDPHNRKIKFNWSKKPCYAR